MIPDTIGALLAFLGLVAPGLLYQMRRETRRAAIADTAFREASRVALTSLVFTVAGFGVLSIVRAARSGWVADPTAWLRQGHAYFVDHYRLVLQTAVIEVGCACLLAVIADAVVRRVVPGQGEVSKTSVWFQVLRADRPAGKVPWLHVHLKTGADYWGFVGYYSAEMAQLDREISLKGPDLQHRATATAEKKRLDDWDAVVISASEIEYLRVQYVPAASEVKHRA